MTGGTENTTTETNATTPEEAKQARLQARANRTGKTVKDRTTGKSVEPTKAARTINPAPKPTGKATKAPVKGNTDTEAQKKAREEAKANKAAEVAGKKLAAEVAKEKREAERAIKAEAKKVKDAEREAARKAREEAAAQREAARKPVIMPGEYPSEFVQEFPIDRLLDLPELVGPEPSAALVSSVRERGVVDPITIIQREDDESTIFLSSGRRRTKASKRADRAVVPARIYTVPADRYDQIANGLVSHLNVTRSENAGADIYSIRNLQNKGFTIEQIAKETAMPIGTVKKRARLAAMPEKWLQLLFESKVPHTVLTEASGLTVEQLDELWKIYETTGKITAKDVKAIRSAGRAAAGEGLDYGDLLDGPTNGDVQNDRKPTPIANSGDLASDVLSFLSVGADASGIKFLMGAGGVITLQRGDQIVQFQGSAGTAPAPAVVEENAPDAGAGEATNIETGEVTAPGEALPEATEYPADAETINVVDTSETPDNEYDLSQYVGGVEVDADGLEVETADEEIERVPVDADEPA